MGQTGQDIFNQVATFLSLTAKSLPVAAQMSDGTGESTTPVIDGTTQVCLWITEGMERLARLCVPITDTAISTATTAGPNGIVGPFTNIQSTSSRTLYVPTFVSIGSNLLAQTNLGFLNNMIWFPPTPDGDPIAWTDTTTYIDLSYFTTQPTFNIQGYFLPIPVNSLTDPIDPFFDDNVRLATAYYVAWRVCAKNRDNAVLQAREMPCLIEFAKLVKETYDRLVLTDSTLSPIWPPVEMDSIIQLTKQSVPRT